MWRAGRLVRGTLHALYGVRTREKRDYIDREYRVIGHININN